MATKRVTKAHPQRKNSKGLTSKQQLFIDHYLQTFNGAEAARRAGYPARSAYAVAWENLRKPEIAAIVARRLDDVAMQANEVLARLSEQGRANLAEFFQVNPDGTIGWDFNRPGAKQAAHLLKKVRTTRNITRHKDGGETETIQTEVELHDAQTALLALAKHHKLMTDTIEHHGHITIDSWKEMMKKAHDAGAFKP